MSQRSIIVRNSVPDLIDQIKVASKNVRIYSPYLTSDVAEAVISATDKATSQIFTTFEAATFASGGSSIETLRAIIEAGYTVFEIPNLHAKIVITENAVFVGSQNLTRGGTTNRETTAFLDGEEESTELRNQIQQWDGYRKRITLPMVTYLETQIEHLKTLIQPFNQRAQEIDIEIDNRYRPEPKPKIVDPITAKYSEEVRVTIKDVSYRTREGKKQYYATLKILDRDTSLMHWKVGKKYINLEKNNRYLMYLKNNNRICWVSLHKTEISKFSLQLEPDDFDSCTYFVFTDKDKKEHYLDFKTKTPTTDWNNCNFILTLFSENKEVKWVLDILNLIGDIKIKRITEFRKIYHDEHRQPITAVLDADGKFILVPDKGKEKILVRKEQFTPYKSYARLEDCESLFKLDTDFENNLNWQLKELFNPVRFLHNSIGSPPNDFLFPFGPDFTIRLRVNQNQEILVIEEKQN